MSTNQEKLWQLIDRLRTNAHLHSYEYFVLVLGLIFLKLADEKFRQVDRELRAVLTPGSQSEPEPSSYKAHGAIYLPPESKFDYLNQFLGSTYIREAINRAMREIEQYNEDLWDVLTTNNYSQLDNRTLFDLLSIVNRITVDTDSKKAHSVVFLNTSSINLPYLKDSMAVNSSHLSRLLN